MATETKTCTSCGQPKPLDAFQIKRDGAMGRRPQCTPCRRTETSERYATDSTVRRRRRAAGYKWKYGITIERYEEMLAEQRGCCAICGCAADEDYALAIDHDHRCCPGTRSCGRCVRGLLCQRCNSALAFVESALLDNALAYLKLRTSDGR